MNDGTAYMWLPVRLKDEPQQLLGFMQLPCDWLARGERKFPVRTRLGMTATLEIGDLTDHQAGRWRKEAAVIAPGLSSISLFRSLAGFVEARNAMLWESTIDDARPTSPIELKGAH